MPLEDKKVYGIRGSIPTGYILGRSDGGDGDVQLLSLDDLLALGLQGVITATAAAVAPAPTQYLTDGGDPPQFITDGNGNFLTVN